MPVNLLVTSQKFFSEFKNGTSFTDNPSDFTPNLAGSVMENLKVVREIEVSWFSQSVNGRPFTSVNSGARINWNGGTFITDGFSVNDTITFQVVDSAGTLVSTHTGTVASLTEDVMVFTAPLSPVLASGIYSTSFIRGTTDLTALRYTFGLIDNDATAVDPASKVSGNDQGYYGAAIGEDTGGGRPTTFVDLLRLGKYKDWQTGSMRARYVSNTDAFTQKFEIEHELTIVPYYLDGQLTNLQNNITPDDLLGLDSYKYAFTPEFRTGLSNPNSRKTRDYIQDLGSVAWFNENFNGFQNLYTVDSIAYEEESSGDPVEGILISSKTKITVTVSKTVGSFTGGERFGAYISYLPEEAEYQNTTLTNLKENFIYDRAVNNEGAAGVAGDDFITDCTASVVSGSLEVVIELEYSTAQKATLATRANNRDIYSIVAVQVGDNTISSSNSDKVMLLAGIDKYGEGVDIPGLMAFTKFDIYPPDQQISSGTGYTDSILWNEDGIAIDHTFTLDLNKSAVINSLEFVLAAYKASTDTYTALDSYTYNNIANAIVSSGVQQLVENTTRGYILESGDQFNKVTLETAGQVAGIQSYNGVFGQKISWQDWIANNNIDPVFFDVTKPNDNLNNKSSNYSNQNGYTIRLIVNANVSGISDLGVAGSTDYRFVSNNITIYDYDEDGNVTPVWAGTINTIDPDTSTDLGGKIKDSGNTLFRVTWVSINAPILDLAPFWAYHRIEQFEQSGYDIEEINTLTNSPNNTFLKPNNGSNLYMYLSGGNIITECYIDGDNTNGDYSISARLHNNTGLEGKLTSPDNTIKNTSGIVDVKVESP